MVNRRFLSKLALCAAFFALGVIALGAFTRLMDAGLGCPDWPGCYGRLLAPLTDNYNGTHLVVYKAWAEMVHRYFVGGLSLFILVIIGLIMTKRTLRVTSNVIMSGFLTLLLAYQIMLGQWTVTLKLLPIIVTQHLLGGFLILSTLWLIYLNNSGMTIATKIKAGKLLPLAIVGLVLLITQILLGAWTSTNYASLSCPDFPFCLNDQSLVFHFKSAFDIFAPVGVNYEGGVLPTEIRQTIQMTHRLGAVLITCYLFMLTALTMLKFNQVTQITKTVYLMMALLIVQLCIGISNVIFKLPLANAVCHNIVAALLLLALITLVYKLSILNRKAPLV